ncbi:SURF1 family protein [Sphingomonas sp. NPDC079357]|uniref:SURF1 family protein n=1 Tax=Sphingomonas sp. NPDC079357 TaxID=3364518 RepID=UPI00384D6AC4
MWQIERRAWKLELIAAVNERAHATPSQAPGPPAWGEITAERDAYRRVRVTGRFDHTHETKVVAITGRGSGNWLLTPLKTDAGWTVLINRGFLPDGVPQMSRPDGKVTVTGLLRVTEPRGQFLRANSPRADRWFSRDVRAITAARGLSGSAPYFIDADATPNAGGYPVGGLTVTTFRNAHLSYALTWFALAGLSLLGLRLLLRDR